MVNVQQAHFAADSCYVSVGTVWHRPPCSASPITYDVSQTVGAGSVTGFIETDGTIGVLSTGNILDWNLLLNDSMTTLDLVGPPGGQNSAGVGGSDLSATATQLLFNFSGMDGGNFAILGSGGILCYETSSACFFGNLGAGVGLGIGFFPEQSFQLMSLSGTQVIGTSGVLPSPEPGSVLLLGSGLLGLGLLRLQRRRAHSAKPLGGAIPRCGA
jgi:hypothetical protein